MGFLCMTKFALYTLLSLNQSEWIREQDIDLTWLKPPWKLFAKFIVSRVHILMDIFLLGIFSSGILYRG